MSTPTLTPANTTPRPARALATVETIAELAPIPGADAILRARIRGWDVVVKLGEFAVGDRCVYFEVDTLLDVADPRFEFLAPRGVRTDTDGVYGHVLKTARFRGQYSQGLVLPLEAFPELAGADVGDDVTDLLPVIKWEPPIPANIAGSVRGPLPAWICTTDEDRIQNTAELLYADGADWVATEKIDGTSTTMYIEPDTGVRGVCSRAWDILPADGNTLWRMAAKHQVHDLLEETWPGRRAAVQGETYGEGIQSNPLRVKGQHFAVFTINVDGVELPRAQWPNWALNMSVPVRPELEFPVSVDQALADVETLTSAITPGRGAEGVVWRPLSTTTVTGPDGQVLRASMKVLSRKYLLKHDR